jgi:DNA integrity scanning protein DisA with diadenylate cyclase activity
MRHEKRMQNNLARECGINDQKALRLAEAGYGRLRDLRAASDEELLIIQGIGPGTVKKIRATIGGG